MKSHCDSDIIFGLELIFSLRSEKANGMMRNYLKLGNLNIETKVDLRS